LDERRWSIRNEEGTVNASTFKKAAKGNADGEKGLDQGEGAVFRLKAARHATAAARVRGQFFGNIGSQAIGSIQLPAWWKKKRGGTRRA